MSKTITYASFKFGDSHLEPSTNSTRFRLMYPPETSAKVFGECFTIQLLECVKK